MTSYNLLNGVHSSERRDLLEDVLRAEFGYRGIVMTDWIIMPMIGVDKSKWISLMCILSIVALPLTLLEYFFTKERITEETDKADEQNKLSSARNSSAASA